MDFKIKISRVLLINLFALLFISISVSKTFSQCIDTFPFVETFENNPSWTAGGSNSDWAWGTPNHTYISNAGEGEKSWSIGGLSGSSYNDLQLSYLQSPCFDCSNLDYPWISFKIFWETEFKWDGVTFQYSTNNGTTWQNLGAAYEPTNCMTQNWFNHDNITWLTSISQKHGWTGRVGGNSGSCTGGSGSGDWVTAKHCMSMLQGEDNVRFRFLFGSGNSCNDFDGVAIDEIRIENNVPTNANFSFNCLTSSSVQFNNLSNNCSPTLSWNFGDPNSNSNNTSTIANPIHTFSAPGTYTVSLQVSSPCSQAVTFSKTVTILEGTTTAKAVSCFGGNDGEISVVTNANASILWNFDPSHVGTTLSNLLAGDYSLTISKENACSLSLTKTVSEPNQLTLLSSIAESCQNECNGRITLTASGGNPPYSYFLNNAPGNTINNNLCEGNYSVAIVDSKLCSKSSNIDLFSYPEINLESPDLLLCIGGSGFLTATGADTYSWNPSEGLSTTIGASVFVTVSENSIYQLIGSKANGCKDTISVNVFLSDVFSPHADFFYSPRELDIYDTYVTFENQSQNASAFQWTISNLETIQGENISYLFPTYTPGNYFVCLLATNELNCRDSICQTIKIKDISTLFVPNSFSPNGDKHNNEFKVFLQNADANSFTIEIFNRWGELIFSSNQIDFSWDGTYKGKDCPIGIYSWKMSYIDKADAQRKNEAGFLNLVR